LASGRRFKIDAPTLATVTQGERLSVTVPTGGIITVLADNEEGPNALASVLYNAEIMLMFVEDIRARGDEIGND
jgi:hypothetical protein